MIVTGVQKVNEKVRVVQLVSAFTGPVSKETMLNLIVHSFNS